MLDEYRWFDLPDGGYLQWIASYGWWPFEFDFEELVVEGSDIVVVGCALEALINVFALKNLPVLQ